MWRPASKRDFIIFFLLFFFIRETTAVEFYPFGESVQDSSLPKRDDAFTTIDISTDFSFFGKVFRQVHISTNGIIYFGQGSTSYTPQPFPLTEKLSVAAYWVDSDPRRGGDIFYRQEFNPQILNKISSKIKENFVEFQSFKSNWALITTFSNVSRYGCNLSCENVVTHQTILTTDGIRSFVIFLYDRLEYASAQIGFNAGDGKRFFQLPQSNTASSGLYALENSNIGNAGEWIFSIDETIKGSCNSQGRLQVYPKKVFYIGNQDVYLSGPCLNGSQVMVKIDGHKITCDVFNNSKIHCITPYSDRPKRVDIEVDFRNVIFKSFLLLHGLSDRLVTQVHSEYLNNSESNDIIRLKLNPKLEGDKLKVRGMQQTLYLDENRKLIGFDNFDIYIDVPNTDHFNFTIKEKTRVKRVAYVFKIYRIISITYKLITRITILSKSNMCNDWYINEPSNKRIKEITEEESQRNPCSPRVPASLPSTMNGGFKIDEACKDDSSGLLGFTDCMFHKGAKVCYRSTNNPNGRAVQCCYNNKHELLLGRPGGGTLDMIDSDLNRVNHFVEDVMPYLYCCVFADECHKYYEKRSSVDSKHFRPPSPPFRTSGDPHFTTLDGFQYTFNPIGEFIYLRTPETIILCRISRFRQTRAAYFSAFAIKTENEEIVQVELSAQKKLLITIGESTVDPESYSFENITVDFMNTSTVSIITSSGISINIYALSEMLHVVATLSNNLKGKVSGLIGNWDDNQLNDLMTPDGLILPTNSTPFQIHSIFGMSWITSSNTSFFIYENGKSWLDYQDPVFIPIFNISSRNTQCGNDTNCQYDYFITGDIDVAKSNLIISEMSESIRLENKNAYEVCVVNMNVENGRVLIEALDLPTEAEYELKCNEQYVINGASKMNCKHNVYSNDLGTCEKDMTSAVEVFHQHYSWFTFLAVWFIFCY